MSSERQSREPPAAAEVAGDLRRPGAGAPVGPADCALAIGIPICRESFETRRRRGTSDYARRFSGWPEYRARFAWVLTELLPRLTELGVTVADDVTCDELGALFARHRVVILFSHWRDEDQEYPLGAVELDEGLVDIDDIVNAVPTDYDGFLDLCVCHPKELPGALLQARPRCRLKYLHGTANPKTWMLFYGTLFKSLRAQPRPYLDALVRTWKVLTSSEISRGVR